MELCLDDRTYTHWKYKTGGTEVVCNINPLVKKLFTGDIIQPDGKLIHSPYRNNNAIPGILVIDGKTYGREHATNNDNRNGKLLYMCIPEDKALPVFLVGYAYKCNQFQKQKINKYVTFKIKEWREKHPTGTLTETIGDVNQHEHFYTYQLYCKQLNNPLGGFNKATTEVLKQISREKIISSLHTKRPAIEDRRTRRIFSIDPAGCQDIDDALGLTLLDAQNVVVSVYIANVPALLDHLQLWAHVSDRVATVYLPNGKIPMLPPILSDDLCSLLQYQERCAFVMDIHLCNDTEIRSITFTSAIINVERNYVYEEARLINDTMYQRLLTITRHLVKTYRYVDSITDSHEVVEFYMIFMNYECSKVLLAQHGGIFRATHTNNEEKDAKPSADPGELARRQALSPQLQKVINTFQYTSGYYCPVTQVAPHALIGQAGLPSYTHITSPIRRLVDLLNLIELQKPYMSTDARAFNERWQRQMTALNETMKNIRKVQQHCQLLAFYSTTQTNVYQGLLFNKQPYLAGVGALKDWWQYTVYIPDLNMLNTLKTSTHLVNYTQAKVSIHLFNEEAHLKQKIRLQLV